MIKQDGDTHLKCKYTNGKKELKNHMWSEGYDIAGITKLWWDSSQGRREVSLCEAAAQMWRWATGWAGVQGLESEKKSIRGSSWWDCAADTVQLTKWRMFLIKKKNLLTQGNLQIIEYSLIGALTSLTPTERQKTDRYASNPGSFWKWRIVPRYGHWVSQPELWTAVFVIQKWGKVVKDVTLNGSLICRDHERKLKIVRVSKATTSP